MRRSGGATSSATSRSSRSSAIVTAGRSCPTRSTRASGPWRRPRRQHPFLKHPAGFWLFLVGAVSRHGTWLAGGRRNNDAWPWLEMLGPVAQAEGRSERFLQAGSRRCSRTWPPGRWRGPSSDAWTRAPRLARHRSRLARRRRIRAGGRGPDPHPAPEPARRAAGGPGVPETRTARCLGGVGVPNEGGSGRSGSPVAWSARAGRKDTRERPAELPQRRVRLQGDALSLGRPEIGTRSRPGAGDAGRPETLRARACRGRRSRTGRW